jgi:hypothetical protein
MIKKYKPNFNDQRVKTRVTHALGFVRAVMNTTSHAWSTRFIDKHLGSQSNPLSQYLRRKLLIATKETWSKDHGKCKEYILNQEGYDFLLNTIYPQQTQIPTQTEPTKRYFDSKVVDAWIKKEFGQSLSTQQFTYKDQSNRLWHPLQSVKKEHKKRALESNGFVYHYDIECCAPSLILQYAHHCGLEEYLPTIRNYIKNRKEIREELAIEAELSEKQVKVLINALFCGARLGKNSDFALSRLVNNDKAVIEFLQQHPFIVELKKEIAICWDFIKSTLERRRSAKGRLLPINSKEKWSIYFSLERRVLNEVAKYLRNKNIGHFLEHDGWSAVKDLDLVELTSVIKSTTGFNINIERSSRYVEKFEINKFKENVKEALLVKRDNTKYANVTKFTNSKRIDFEIERRNQYRTIYPIVVHLFGASKNAINTWHLSKTVPKIT